MNCIGGKAGKCNRFGGQWSHKKVICNVFKNKGVVIKYYRAIPNCWNGVRRQDVGFCNFWKQRYDALQRLKDADQWIKKYTKEYDRALKLDIHMIDLTGETVAKMKNQWQDVADVMDGVGAMMKSYKKFKKKRTKVMTL